MLLWSLAACTRWQVPDLTPSEAPLADPVERVVVVGAGVAGLTLAQSLSLAGVEVVVVEARDRIGGRVHTVDLGGPVDVGAAWVHTIRGNPVRDVLDANGLGRAYDDSFETSRMHGVDSDGTVLANPDLRAMERFAGRVLDAAYDVPDADSVAGLVARELDAEGWEEPERSRLQYGAEVLEGELEFAAPVASMSAAALTIDDGFRGRDEVPVGGYAGLVDLLAEGLDIQTGRPVTTIRVDGAGVEVEASGPISGSHVVVTVPLGVLKAGNITFEPPLDATWQDAVDRLAMATLEKVVLTFDAPFWPEDQGTFLQVEPRADAVSSVCIDFSEHVGRAALACLSGGTAVAERWGASDSELVEATLVRLSAMTGRAVPTPVDAVVTRWSEDPHVGGSYAYVPVGASWDDMDAIATPQHGRVLFAGEHTNAEAPGTVHGAMLSGLREARRLGVESDIPGLDR
ncbi:MAG: FAD-dependent oxidoreductase [Alphaproteobacteria bacterium]|nr:FAD-dependent oxidoreductase [Alphaproteobacteria bacterium]